MLDTVVERVVSVDPLALFTVVIDRNLCITQMIMLAVIVAIIMTRTRTMDRASGRMLKIGTFLAPSVIIVAVWRVLSATSLDLVENIRMMFGTVIANHV